MSLVIAALCVGFVGLIWSADRFVAGAAAIAHNHGMSTVMIGLTIVALGTSAPEILVSIDAALTDASQLAVGNAIGSNLANLGMVLGITALVSPIPIVTRLLGRELPLLLFVTMLGGYCIYDLNLDVIDGIALLGCLAAVFFLLIYNKTHQPHPEEETDLESIPEFSPVKAWGWFLVGLVLLLISADALVWGATELARHFAVSELIIGLTVVAVGTSLPELAASAASALKGHHEIALGNILGSNMLNILGVLAMPALINPTELEPDVISHHYAAMTAMTLLLAVFMYIQVWRKRQDHPVLGRTIGAIFVILYGLYYASLV